MKKIAALLLLSSMLLCSGNVTVETNGTAVFKDGETELLRIYPFFATLHAKKWFQPSLEEFVIKTAPETEGVTRFTGTLPANDQGELVTITGSWTRRQHNVMEVEMAWKTAHPKHIRQAAFFFDIPMALIAGKTIRANDKDYIIENISKFGTVVINNTKLNLTLFQGIPGRQISLSSENFCNLVVANTKDRRASVRINDIPFHKKNQIKLTIRWK